MAAKEDGLVGDVTNSKPPGRVRPWLRSVWRSRAGRIAGVTLSVVGFWFMWERATTWHAARELFACWGRELAKPWSEDPERWKPIHDQTMDVIRRHRRTLLPFLAARLEPCDNRPRERVCQLLNYVPFLRWRPEAQPDWSNLALSCIEELGPEAKPVVPILEEMLHRPRAARNAALALMAVGPEAIPCFERGFASPNADVRLAILEGLGNSDRLGTRRVLAILLRALDDPDRRVQRSAAGLVGSFPEVRVQVKERLATLLIESADAGAAAGPALGLALLGEEALDPLFTTCVDHTNRQVRHAALGGLGLVDEMSRYQAPPGDRPTFNDWRCIMNARMLRAAFEFYSGKEEQARHELLERLAQHPAARVQEQAAAALARRSGRRPEEPPTTKPPRVPGASPTPLDIDRLQP